MRKQVLVFHMASLVCAPTAVAATFSWTGAGSSDWTLAGNWWNLDLGPTATPPAAGDLAIIGFPIAGFDAYPRPAITTGLYTPASPLGTLGMDWWDETGGVTENATLTVAAGGGLEVNNTWMNVGGQETATITLAGGFLRSWNEIQMEITAGGTSMIHIDSGFVYTPSLIFGPGNSNIDLEPGAFLYLAGDQSASVDAWIGSNLITGGNDTLDVQYDLTSFPGLTAVYAVVPEPATLPLTLLALGCALRRRR